MLKFTRNLFLLRNICNHMFGRKFGKLSISKRFSETVNHVDIDIDQNNKKDLNIKEHFRRHTFNEILEIEENLKYLINNKSNSKLIESEAFKLIIIVTRNRKFFYNSNILEDACLYIFKELRGDDFPLILLGDFLNYLLDRKKLKEFIGKFPANVPEDTEKLFYRMSESLTIYDLSLLSSIPVLFKDKVSVYFLPFLEKVLFKKLQDQALDSKYYDAVFKYYLRNANEEFIKNFFNLISNAINERDEFNSHNYKRFFKHVKKLEKDFIINKSKLELDRLTEIIANFVINIKRKLFYILREQTNIKDFDLLMDMLVVINNRYVPKLYDKDEFLPNLIYNYLTNKIDVKNEHQIILMLKHSFKFDLDENLRRNLNTIAVLNIPNLTSAYNINVMINFFKYKYKNKNSWYHDTLIQTLSLKYAKLLIRSEDVGYLRNKLICLSTLITKCENYELSLFEKALFSTYIKQIEMSYKNPLKPIISEVSTNLSLEEDENIK